MALTQAEINEVMQQLQPIIAKALNESTSIAQAQANIQQGVTQYIGARYVPIFADPIEWDNKRAYEALTIVLYQGNSFTTRQYTPAGIDINNEAFWAETGNYNAQIEQYRREVRGAVDAAAEAKKVAADASAKVEKIAGDIVVETQRAEKAENSLRKSVTRENSVMHFGAVDLEKEAPNNKNPQGMCIRDDVLVCVSASSTDSNDCVVYDISRKTGEVLKKTNVSWGHANCITYDKMEDCLYVCPSIDYSIGNDAYVHYMYKVDPQTYKTIDTITFDFEPHSISIDNVTGECYLTSEQVNPFSITLYAVNKSTWATTKIGVIDTNLTAPNFMFLEPYGTQNVRSYNGELWYLVGGNGVNALLNLDKTTAKTKRVISNLNMSYIYPLTEAECFDFTKDGDIYLWSRCDWIASGLNDTHTFGVLSMINMYGGMCCIYPNSVYDLAFAQVKPSYQNVARYGTNKNPFSSVVEAIMAQQYGFAQCAYIVEDCTLSETIDVGNLPLLFYIKGGCTLTLGANVYCSCLSFRNFGTGVATLNVSKDVFIGTFVEMSKLTVTGSTINITRGVFNAVNVTGGTFDGDNHSALFKSAGSTGTYSRFIQSSVS